MGDCEGAGVGKEVGEGVGNEEGVGVGRGEIVGEGVGRGVDGIGVTLGAGLGGCVPQMAG